MLHKFQYNLQLFYNNTSTTFERSADAVLAANNQLIRKSGHCPPCAVLVG
jgi:hypothetical protein